MEMEKMTTALQRIIAEAQRIAMVRKHQTIDVAHLWKHFLQPDSFARIFISIQEWQSMHLNQPLIRNWINQW